MPNDVINTVTIHGTTYDIGGSGGGHTIKNPAGTAMTQRSNLQFVDLTVSDDSTNDATKVESVHIIQSESELENLPDGLYMLDEDEGTVIDGSAVGYDNTDSGLEATNVQDAIDEVVEALDDKIDISAKGVANGVAELDSTGKVPSSQLPSFVDDVIEVADYDHLPATGESGKIYVALDTNKTYRWSGTEYVEISESLALGETSSTAYRGDRGKTAYDHSQITSGNPHNVTKSEVGLGNVNNTSDKNKPLSDATKEALLMKLGVEALTNHYETSMMVEMPYDAGKIVYVEQEGRLYRTTTSINIGDTLVPDTNCVHVDIEYLLLEKLGIDNLTSVVELVDRASSAHSMYSRFYIAYLNKWAKATANIAVNDMLVMGTNYEIVTIEDVFGSIESVLSQMSTSISNKVNKETGKGLSTNDYTTTEKNKVATIDNKADKVSSATNGNLAGLNSSGNLTDSGWNGAKDTTPISGNPISISGLKANQLAKDPIITLEPIQAGSGTPSPSNIRAISGYDKVDVLSCGKNILEGIIENCAIDSSGLIYASGTTKMGFAKVGQGKTYTVKSDDSTLIGGIFLTKPAVGSVTYNGTRIVGAAGDYTFTAPITGYIAFRCTSAYTTLQIEEGSTSTTYEPPVKTTSISESLGQTVYGGSLELRTGVFTGTMAIKDMGDLNWGVSGSGTFHTGEIANSTKLVSSCYAYNDDSRITNNGNAELYLNNNEIAYRHGTNDRIYVKNTSYSDATTFKNAMVGQTVCYELATPFTIQLTPHEISLLKDYAYVSTNGTNIALDYHNGELASLADVSQLGETVNELGDYIGANNLGHEENLLNHSSSNIYQFPNDGYIIVFSGSATSGAIDVALRTPSLGNMGGIQMRVHAGGMMQTTFVKKGMIAFTIQNTAGSSAVAVYRAVTP